jgi:acyl-CoA dehydrogenase
MDFAFDQRTEQLRTELLAFMDEHVYPAEPEFERSDPGQPFSWERPKIMADLRAEARRRGLWNLFLPDQERGAGLTNLQYAPLAEITGRSPHVAPEALNCNAPDTGNMELLHLHGTPEQQERWLEPLLEARIRSGFCMTEPDVASSDASNIALRMTPTADGGFVLNGRKWWTTGALSGDVAVLLVMGVSEPDAPRHERRACRSSGACRCSVSGTRHTGGTPRWCSTTSGWVPRRCWGSGDAVSRWPRHGWARAGSTTACG